MRFSDSLPEACDVVIIGGGVIGIFASLFMARAGLSVIVCEKGRVAGEQSSRNWGWIRQQGRDKAELPIMMEASRLWEETDQQAGGKLGFKRQGVAYLASSQKELNRITGWLDIAKEHQLDTAILTEREIDGLIDRRVGNGERQRWIGAIRTPSDARAEPWQAVSTVAMMAQDAGVRIMEECAVRKLDLSAGTVSGVITENGTVRCENVVLSGGAWSSLFARAHGVAIPQLSVRSSVVRTQPLPDFYAGNAADEKLAFRRREDGSYTLAGGGQHELFVGPDAIRGFFKYLPVAKQHLKDTTFSFNAPKGFPDAWGTPRQWNADEQSPFEKTRVLNPKPNPNQVDTIRQNFASRFPGIGLPKVADSWAGMIDTMPDVVPVVDRVEQMPGLVIATGMSGHGFGIGPGFGRIICELVRGKTPGHDISRFRLSRFTDGSVLYPGPAL